MTRAGRLLAGIGLLAGALLFALYGLFAILYRGDSGGNGDTYVKFGGHELDADLVGALALVAALVALACGVILVRRRLQTSDE